MFQQNRTLPAGSIPYYCLSTENIIKWALTLAFLFLFSTGLQSQNNALSFDGANDNVSIPALGNGFSQFTIETWFNATSIATSPGLNGIFNTNSWVAGDVHFQINSTRVQLAVNGSTPIDVAFNAGTLNTWHHLAVTYNSVTKSITFYVNGDLLQSVILVTAVPANFTAAEIGAWNTQRYFAGMLDEYRIWNTERTPADIKNNMFTSMTGTETGLLASFNFNQGTAGGSNTGLTTLLNAKGSNNGTLANFALSGATSNWVTGFKPAPTNHVTNFTGSLVTNKLTLTWTDATGTVIPDGYLIYASKTNTFDNPVDGVFPFDDNDLGNGTGVIKIAKSVQSYNGWINEEINTTYYFRIIPFTNPGIVVKYLVTEPVPVIQLTSKQLFAQITIPSFQFSAANYWGDYNNDGWLDYVASSYFDGCSTVFLNNKNNTFSINPAFNDINHSNLYPGDWVDINYDGNLDLPARSGIYLNGSNGAVFSLAAMPRLKSCIDIDKDGDLDLAGEIYPSVNISILRNNGAFSFTEVTGNYFKDTDGSFDFLDFNNDGYPDIVISGRYSLDYKPHTTIYKNEGAGKFTEQKQILLDGLGQTKIKTGDVNSDGKDDIILAGLNSEGNFALLLYLNNGLNFNKISIPLQVGIAQGSIDLADINSDGLADIIFAGSNADRSAGYFKVLRNNGDQTFSEIYNLPGLTGSSSFNITDFNNDGAIDIIVNGNIILQNNSVVSNLNPQKLVVTSAAKKDAGVEFQWSGTDDKTPAAGITYNLRIGRSAGASDVQATTSLPTGQRKQLKPGNMGSNSKYYRPLSPGTYYWSVQAVDNSFKGGEFSTEQSIVVDSVATGKLQAISVDKSSLKIKWINGNGNKRALFCKIGTDGTTKPINNKTYTASVSFGEGDQIGNSGWYCVYNGVGDSVTVQNLTEFDTYVFQAFEYFGNKGAEKYMLRSADGNPAIFGTSGFTKQSDIAAADNANNSFVFGDYNNDGLVDFLTNNSYSGLRIFKNKGNNTFELQAIPSIEKLDYGTAAWVDFNNDGWLDIIATGEYSINFYMRPKSTRLYRNDQNNVFTDVSGGTAVIRGLTESALAAADYNNDGKVDFFVDGTESLWSAATPVVKSKIYKNNGTPTDCFTEQTEIVIPPLNNGAAVWGDLNNDGWSDLLLSGASADGFYYLYNLQNNKNNSFSEHVMLKLKSPFTGFDYNNSKIKTLDYDKDGNLDILVYVGNNNRFDGILIDTTILFHNNGNATFSKDNTVSFPKNVAYSSFDIGDFNNDKAQDIIFSTSFYPNLFRLYQNNSPATPFSVNPDFNFSWAPISESFPDWNGTAFCDYDNDGDADILASNYNQIYFINNNRIMKSGTFPVNKTPVAPSNVRATQRPGELVVDWSPVTSDETGSLSYNVVLSSGGVLINSSNSDMTSGKLLIPATGNTGLNNFAIFKGLPVGTYSVTVQAVDGAFTGGAWSVPITVELKNTKAFFIFDTVCYKAATKLSDLSTSTKKVISRKWKYNNNVISTDSVAHFVFPHSGTDNITLVITDGEGTKDSVTHAIKIKARPTALYSATTVCLGSTTVFVNNSSRNGSGTVTWNWNYDNGDPASTDSIPINKVYGLAKTYKTKLIVTASNGCADTLAKDVIVGAIPNAITSVSGKTVFCQGDSVQLIAENNPLYNYQWKLDNNDLSNTNLSTYKVKLNSGAYSVRITNPLANCIATSAVTNVTVLPAPVSPFISASGIPQFCQGDSVALSVTNTAGYDYQWKLNGGATGSNKNTFIVKSTGEYTVSVSNSSGCAAASVNSVAVIVFPTPSVSTISRSGSTTFCQGGSVELSVPANASYIYRWQNSGSDIPGATTNSFITLNSGVYSLTLSNSDGCISKTEQVTVNSLTAPAPPSIMYNRPLPIQFCEGDSVVLSAANIAGYSYQWKLNGGAAGTNMNSITARTAGNWSLVVTNTAGCSAVSANSPSVVVYPKPAVTTLSKNGPSTICAGESVELSAPAINGYKYQWSRSGADLSGANSSYYTAVSSGDYSLLISNSDNCSSKTDAITVVVNKKPDKPVIDKGNYSEGKCLGETPIKLSVENMAGYSYKWYRNGAAVSSKYFVEGLLEQGYYFVETSVNNCSNKSDSLNVFFAPAAEKPKIFAQGPNSWYLASSIIGPDIKYRWFYNGELIPGADKYYYAAFRQLGKYNLSISRANSCYTLSDTIKIPVISKILGIDDIDPFYGMKIYPNPTSGLFSIEMENQLFGEVSVDILSQDGRKVFSLKFDKSTTHFFSKIDISGQGKGLYLMNIRMDKYSKVEKLILE